MNDSLYQEVLKSNTQDLFPDVYSGDDYEIYLEPEQLSTVISSLHKNKEYSVISHILKFIPNNTKNFIINYDWFLLLLTY